MGKIKKILVAIDLSDCSAETIKYGADLANNMEAELIIVNVIDQRIVEALEEASQTVSDICVRALLEDQARERAHKIQNLIEETSSNNLPIKKVVCIGVPFQKLVQIVKDEGADLVVIGRKGRSSITHVLFGSTAKKMFRHCPVPLLSVCNGNNKV